MSPTALRLPRGAWAAGGKRVADVVVALVLLVGLAPLLLAVACAVLMDSRGSPFFTDDRVGLGGRRFRMWKFRTMVSDATSHALGRKLALEDPRITRVGQVLRRFSLDEVPQLWNVLKGDMSLVGPRPGLWEHLLQYNGSQRLRLLVRPGLTGLAQVSGRNALLWSERIELDLEYIRRLSLALDLKILAATFRTVVRGDGLYSAHQERDGL